MFLIFLQNAGSHLCFRLFWLVLSFPAFLIMMISLLAVIQTPNGTTTVINSAQPNQIVYVDDYPYRRRRYGGYGYGAGMGFLGGAMLGSMMMYPYYW